LGEQHFEKGSGSASVLRLLGVVDETSAGVLDASVAVAVVVVVVSLRSVKAFVVRFCDVSFELVDEPEVCDDPFASDGSEAETGSGSVPSEPFHSVQQSTV
jgi:hypothetical protein